MQCSSEAAFLHHCRTNFENGAARTVLREIWHTLVFGLSRDLESVSCVENSHANKKVVYRNSHSCNGCFDWCIGFLNCTGTSIQRQFVSIIIMKTGTCHFAPFGWTNENLFDMRRNLGRFGPIPFRSSHLARVVSARFPG